jgi:hypothetical protein
MGEYDYPPLWSLDELLDWLERGGAESPRWHVAIRTPGEDADEVFRAAWAAAPCLVLAEECDRYRVGHEPLPGLSYIVEYGRHRGISLMALTRRPASIPRTLTANASRAVVFKTVEPRDVKYWADFLPDGGAAAIQGLEGHGFVDADLWRGTFEVCGTTRATDAEPAEDSDENSLDGPGHETPEDLE